MVRRTACKATRGRPASCCRSFTTNCGAWLRSGWREAPGQTLQATALVHEAYLRLVGSQPDRPWDGRGHFFAAAAQAMRRILVENARRRHRLKRGGARARVDLDKAQPTAPEADGDLLALDEALERLGED